MRKQDYESMQSALWAIANMQITEHTDKEEVLALCMSIARITLQGIQLEEIPDSSIDKPGP